jgi:tetratricopeptide (TPR) repeat protein
MFLRCLFTLVAAGAMICLLSVPELFPIDAGALERDMIASGDYAGTLSKLKELEKEDPRNDAVLLAIGEAYYGLSDYEKARDHFEMVLEGDAGKERKDIAQYGLSLIRDNISPLSTIETSTQELALAKGESSREEIVDGLNSAHIVVLDSIMRKKYYYAVFVIPHLKWLRENYPEMEEVDRIMADVYYSAYLYKPAAEYYRQCLLSDPDDPVLQRKTADAYVGAGDYSSARSFYGHLADTYEKEREFGEAEKIRDIIGALPGSYEDIEQAISEGDTREAESICRRRLSLNPSDHVALTQLGRIYWKTDRRRDAIGFFRKALRIAPDYPIARLFLGKAYFFERKPEKGLQQFEIFKEKMDLLPELSREAKRNYIHNLHYICYIYYTRKDYEKTMAECRKILDLDPGDLRAHLNLGVCYYVHLHNKSKAYSRFKKVLEEAPGSKEAGSARYYIDYMRRNPDHRTSPDMSFIYER